MRILLVSVIIQFLFVSCSSQERKIFFVNKSGSTVDSTIINIFSATEFSIKKEKIINNDTIVNFIPIGRPESNNHDITIQVTVYINGVSPVSDFRYNDLSGYLGSDYFIIINDKKKLEWKIAE